MAITKRLVLLWIVQSLILSQAIASAVDISFRSTIGQQVANPSGKFNYPTSVAVNTVTGDVFVMDELFHRIQRFDADGNFITLWSVISGLGVAVDSTDNTVYVAIKGLHKIKKFDANGQLLYEVGNFGAGPGQFNTPRDIAVNPVTQNIYVTDSENRRIQEFTRDGVFVKEWSNNFSNHLYGISTETTGQFVYLSDTGTKKIHKFDTNGNVLAVWGQLGNADGELRWPRGIAIDAAGDVYVASTDNSEIVKYDNSGNFIKRFQGPHNAVDGSFHPRSIDINTTTGDIYVTASYSHRIDRFNPDDTFNYYWGGLDTIGPNFNRTAGVTIDPVTGDIYVADNWNAKIKKFSSNGNFLLEFGGLLGLSNLEDTMSFPSRIHLDNSGNVWLLNGGTFYPDDPENFSDKYVRQFDSSGNFLFAFAHPDLINGMGGLFVDSAAGEIYVANSKRNKIMVFDFTGTFLREFGSNGSNPGQFIRPAGIVLDPNSNTLYVVDSGNNRIQRLDTNGNYIASFGSAGAGPGQLNFRSFSDITLDDYGHIYVADTNNSRIQMFDLEGNYILSFGTSGQGSGQLLFPLGVYAQGTTLAVGDTYGNQVELYDIVPLTDSDNDNVSDAVDNCPATANFSQLDSDSDGVGDVCDIAPIGVDDSGTTTAGATVTVNVLANDSRGNGISTITGVTQAVSGTVTYDAVAGTTTYLPVAGFVGNDSYTYTISDTDGDVDVATVSIQVEGPIVSLTAGVVDTLQYGNNYGTNQHENRLLTTFIGDGISTYSLQVTGYDIDLDNEISVYINGAFLANLSKGPNDDFNGGNAFNLTPTRLVAGGNTIEFRQLNQGWTWGVTNIGVTSLGVLPPPPVIVLTEGLVDSGQYGNNYGTSQHEAALTATFSGDGVSAYELQVTGYDIDLDNEISVYVNGIFLENLSRGSNNGLNAGDVFSITPARLVTGENTIEFRQLNPGWTWGVTNIGVTSLGEPQVPPPPVIVLTEGLVDSGQYGNNYGTSQHEALLTATFTGDGASTYELQVAGYDIDLDNEISVYINGVFLANLSRGSNNGLNGGDVFGITPARLVTGENTIEFRQLNPGWTWGVMNIGIVSLGVTLPPPIVTLTEGIIDGGQYGNNYGSNEHETVLIATFTGDGASDYDLQVTGYDIDFFDEIAVYINDTFFANLSTGQNNGLNAGDVLTIPSSMLVTGTNSIEFRERTLGWKWGVTNISVSIATGP